MFLAFRDFAVDGVDRDLSGHYGFEVYYASKILFENIAAYRVYDGFRFGESITTGYEYYSEVTMIHCLSHYTNEAGYFLMGGSSNVFINCIAAAVSVGKGFIIYNERESSFIRPIIGNIEDVGIYVLARSRDSWNIVIDNPHFEDIRGGAIIHLNEYSAEYHLKGVTIRDGRIPCPTGQKGIVVENAENTRIIHNSFEGDGTAIHLMSGALNTYLEGNYVFSGSPSVIDEGTSIWKNNPLYVTENSGVATFSGDGSTTTFRIEHGLVSTPSKYVVSPLTPDSDASRTITVDDTYITITFDTAPPSGTDNVKFGWWAEV